MNFGELIDHVKTWRATKTGSVSSADETYIKQTINNVYAELLSQEELPWLERETVVEYDAPFIDGAIVATNGVTNVTLKAASTTTYTGWVSAHGGTKMLITGETMYYTVERAETTTLYLDRPYQGTSTASAAYSLYADTYPLPGDFRKIDNVRLTGSSGYQMLSQGFPSYDRRTVHPLKSVATGDPSNYTVWKQRNTKWFETSATVTNGSAYVTLAENSTFYGVKNWQNRCVQSGDGTRYWVRRQNNAGTDTVQLELMRAFGGTSATNTLLTIDPQGTVLLQLHPPPSSRGAVVLKYQGSDHELVANADEPVIPVKHHDSIVKGAIYYMSQFDGETPNEVLDRLFRDWQEARGRMESYRNYDRDARFRRRAWGGPEYFEGYRLPESV
jgi:hypothetical protein